MSKQDIPKEFREIYNKVPVYNQETKEELAYTGSTMIGVTNITVGGTPVKDLKKVDNWTPAQVQRIQMTSMYSAFLDPLGFVMFFE